MAKFKYDVFLSHASADKAVVREFAQRLRGQGLKVWFDEDIEFGDSIPAEIEKGLQASRVLLLFMSKAAFTRDWVGLERHTFIFRDPANTNRRFLPILIKDCDIPDMIAQYKYVDWRKKDEAQFQGLVEALKPASPAAKESDAEFKKPIRTIKAHDAPVSALLVVGERVISSPVAGSVKLWDVRTGACLHTIKAHSFDVLHAEKLTDKKVVLLWDGAIRLWDLDTGDLRPIATGRDLVSLKVLDQDRLVCLADNGDIFVWSVTSDRLLQTLDSGGRRKEQFVSIALVPGGGVVARSKSRLVWWDDDLKGVVSRDSAAGDASLVPFSSRRVAILSHGRVIEFVRDKGFSGPYQWAFDYTCLCPLSNGSVAAARRTGAIEIVNHDGNGYLVYTLEGHTGLIRDIKEIAPGWLATGGEDDSIRIWDLMSGACVRLLGRFSSVSCLAAVDDLLVSASRYGHLAVWDISNLTPAKEATKYTNAKVILVGRSSAGKTGLSLRLAKDEWKATESTHGMTVSQVDLPGSKLEDTAHEVWLWDFAGQPDYRLTSQLFMDEASLAMLVFDAQDENPFEEIEHWEKALKRATKFNAAKLLVAARCDRGGAIVSRATIDEFLNEHGIAAYLETSAKTGDGIADLKRMLSRHIPWSRLPWTSTTKLFKDLKDCIVEIKNQSTRDPEAPVMLRLSELRQRLQYMRPDSIFDEAELRTVVGLLASQGIIYALGFGDKILLQPEWLNLYAAAIVRAAREHIDEMGSMREKDALEGKIDFKDMPRLQPEDERTILRTIVEIFTSRALCLHESNPDLLVFPSYFRRERPELEGEPNVLVTFSLEGPLDEIYATLVVRLSYTETFEKHHLWRNASDFKTIGGGQLGFRMITRRGGKAELQVYGEPKVPLENQALFLRFIHDHLLRRASNLTRVRHYSCPKCGKPVQDRNAIRDRLERGKAFIACQYCDRKIILLDLVEEKLASTETTNAVREMEDQAQLRLDRESLELMFIGHCTATAQEAGQTFQILPPGRGLGVAGEIVFKGDGGRVYLKFVEEDDSKAVDIRSLLELADSLDSPLYIIRPEPITLTMRWWEGERYPDNGVGLLAHGPFNAAAIEEMRKRLTKNGPS